MSFPQDGQMPQPYFGGQQGGEDGNAPSAPNQGGQQQMQQMDNGAGGYSGNNMQMGGAPNSDPDNKTTLWMGELEPWIDENFIRSLWFGMGESVNVKMIRDKFTGSNAGYCFVDFGSSAAAAKALTLNGQPIPNSNRPFKLNWASGGGLADRSRDERGPEFSIFVGDLGPEVNEYVLHSLFNGKFPSCKSAKIMSDPISGLSRGYGFVRFTDEGEQQRALTEMQGVYCGNRPMRISTATPKNKSGAAASGPGPMAMHAQQPGMNPMYGNMNPMGAPPMGFYGAAQQPMNQFTDPNNTTVFVGGLSGYVTEDELRSFFQGFGEITYVKIPPGKGCGFVQFVQRHAAEMAINQMQGYPIGNSRVRLSWGRSQNNSGPAGTPYRPAPPPPVYPNMAMPPAHYGGFQPMKVPFPHLAANEHTSATRGGPTTENLPPRPQPGDASDPRISTYRRTKGLSLPGLSGLTFNRSSHFGLDECRVHLPYPAQPTMPIPMFSQPNLFPANTISAAIPANAVQPPEDSRPRLLDGPIIAGLGYGPEDSMPRNANDDNLIPGFGGLSLSGETSNRYPAYNSTQNEGEENANH